MNGHGRVNLRWTVLLVAAIGLLAAGASVTYLLLRSSDHTSTASAPRTPLPASIGTPASSAGDGSPLPDVVVTLTQEAITRAGIEVSVVRTGATTDRVRAPGVVEPNAYRLVAVTPLVAGRITGVLVELGAHVRRGQTLAEVYSPEVAETQTQFVSMRAELEASEQQLRRTERLVEIGAASRQELERVRAEHTARSTDVDSARSRLTLLGVTPQTSRSNEIAATIRVPAPLSGVVTERRANPGLNVDPSSTLFTVVDLSTVWVVGDLYEKDFSRVRVGSPATITMAAFPDRTIEGRVSYIDPQVNAATRTARLRVEVPNSRNDFRLGMYADLMVGDAGGTAAATVPKGAVQTIGDRTVVYLADPKQPGTFVEREVRIGGVSQEGVEVVSGVRSGDAVVTSGSFFVRAERERLGLRTTSPAPAGAAGSPVPKK
jgi:membrane fusion protein, heavy metal efflux system